MTPLLDLWSKRPMGMMDKGFLWLIHASILLTCLNTKQNRFWKRNYDKQSFKETGTSGFCDNFANDLNTDDLKIKSNFLSIGVYSVIIVGLIISALPLSVCDCIITIISGLISILLIVWLIILTNLILWRGLWLIVLRWIWLVIISCRWLVDLIVGVSIIILHISILILLLVLILNQSFLSLLPLSSAVDAKSNSCDEYDDKKSHSLSL